MRSPLTSKLWHIPDTPFCIRVNESSKSNLSEYLNTLLFVEKKEIQEKDNYPTIDVTWGYDVSSHQSSEPQQIIENEAGQKIFTADGSVQINTNSIDTQIHISNRSLDEPIALGIAIFRSLLLQNGLWSHALAFKHKKQAIIAIGSSGSGKSTLAAALIADSGKILSDDSIVLHKTSKKIQAVSLRGFLRFRSPTQKILPESVQAKLHPSSIIKSWLLDSHDLHEKSIKNMIPKTIWILNSEQARPQQSVIEPISHADALSLWIDNSIPLFFHSHWGLEKNIIFKVLLDLLQQCEIKKVTIGKQLLSNPGKELSFLLNQQTKFKA